MTARGRATLRARSCPRCGRSLDGFDCPACGRVGRRHHGIPSFLENEPGDPVARALADALGDEPLREAARTVADDEAVDRASLLRGLADGRSADWRILVADVLSEPCLDLYAGYGTRALLLGELVGDVTAVEPDLSKLGVLDAREDFDSASHVRPIHADEDTLPFPESSFETVVADLTGRADRPLPSRVATLQHVLAEDGTLVLTLDGWPRRLGLTGRAGLDAATDPPPTGRVRATVRGYDRALRSAGFDQVDLFALFPTASLVELVFDVSSEVGIERAADLLAARTDGIVGRLAPPLFELAGRAGFLSRCFPSYLAVCTNRPRDPPFDGSEQVLTTGRVRSVVLSFDDAEVASVWKVPNRRRHAVVTEGENELLAALSRHDVPITETLPTGTVVETPLGTARREEPMDGRPLGQTLESDPAAVRRVLEIGVDWLVEFQRSFRGNDVTLERRDLDVHLGFGPAGVEPPDLDDPIESFEVPVHGDFAPDNVFIEAGTVTGVIDWEYGALAGIPFVDPAFFVVDTLRTVTGDVESAAAVLRSEDSRLAAVAREAIDRYCDAMDLSTAAFDRLLAAPYVRRLRMDAERGAATKDTAKVEVRARAARALHPEES